jgi:hypothetical protein
VRSSTPCFLGKLKAYTNLHRGLHILRGHALRGPKSGKLMGGRTIGHPKSRPEAAVPLSRPTAVPSVLGLIIVENFEWFCRAQNDRDDRDTDGEWANRKGPCSPQISTQMSSALGGHPTANVKIPLAAGDLVPRYSRSDGSKTCSKSQFPIPPLKQMGV